MFLKSRNLYILVAGHFVLNISSMLDRFQINSIGHAVPIIKEKSTLEIIASLFAIFVLFGVAALIGIAILKTIDLKQLKSQMNLGMNGWIYLSVHTFPPFWFYFTVAIQFWKGVSVYYDHY